MKLEAFIQQLHFEILTGEKYGYIDYYSCADSDFTDYNDMLIKTKEGFLIIKEKIEKEQLKDIFKMIIPFIPIVQPMYKELRDEFCLRIVEFLRDYQE